MMAKKVFQFVTIAVLIVGAVAIYHISTRRIWGFTVYSPPILQWIDKEVNEVDFTNPVEVFQGASLVRSDTELKLFWSKKQWYVIEETIRNGNKSEGERIKEYYSSLPREKRPKLLFSFYFRGDNGDKYWYCCRYMDKTWGNIGTLYHFEDGGWKFFGNAQAFGKDIDAIQKLPLPDLVIDEHLEDKVYKMIRKVYENAKN